MSEKLNIENIRVLVVEDNPIAMNIAVLNLKKINCTVVQAENATQALRMAQQQRFDFILSDIGLPDFSGFVLATKIHQFEQQQQLAITPIIGLTAHAKKDALAQTDHVEMVEIFEKPLRLEVLMPFIEKHAQRNLPTKDAPTEQRLSIENYSDSPLFEPDTIKKQLASDKLMSNVIRYMLDRELPESLEQMNKAFLMQDWSYLAKVMHRFKSSCLYCATTRLLLITQQLEQEIETASSARKTELHSAFQTIAKDTRNALQPWLKS